MIKTKIVNRRGLPQFTLYLSIIFAFLFGAIAISNSPVAAQTVVTTISIGSTNFPVDIDVNSTTNLIYVANEASENVSVIGGETNQVIDTIPVGRAPVAVGVNPSTNMIYVANSLSGDITVIQDMPAEVPTTTTTTTTTTSPAITTTTTTVQGTTSTTSIRLLQRPQLLPLPPLLSAPLPLNLKQTLLAVLCL